MKISKNFVAIFLFATGSILCSNRSEIKFEKPLEDGPIKFRINNEFSNYVFGQKIWIKSILTNNFDSNIFFKEGFDFIGIRFKVFDPNHLRVGSAKQIHVIYTDSVKVIPGEILEAVFPIDDYVNKFNNIEGVYQMQAIFQNIPSNIVNFKMKPPENDNEVQYELFTKMTDISENLSLSTEDRVNNYLIFLDRYPNGPYSPDVFDFTLIAHLMSGKNNKAEEIVSKYFQYNYNSYTSQFIVDHYFTYLTKYAGYTNSDALQRIDSLSIVHKGSESAWIIKNFIKQNSKQ